MSKTRNNLVVSLDERGKDGEVEVLKLSTTSNIMVTVAAIADKVSVHIDDLQQAIDDIKAFQAARGPQPATPHALTPSDLNLLEESEKRAQEEINVVTKDFSN